MITKASLKMINKFKFLFLLCFEAIYIALIPEAIGTKFIITSIVYQTLLITTLWSPKIQKFLTTRITIILLLSSNLVSPIILEPWSRYKTLPPNLTIVSRVIGDTMPGITGENTLITDGYGFRTNEPVTYEDANAYRIFAIGGSTTEEIYLDNRETWTGLLERHLQTSNIENFEVINTGVSGLRAIHHLETLRRTEHLSPDMYIFLMGVNDWNYQIKNELSDAQFLNNFNLSESIIFKSIDAIYNIMVRIINDATYSESSENIRVFDGSYYASQNNSLNRPNVRNIQIQSVDPDYDKYVRHIAQRCSDYEYSCMFVDQPSAYSQQVTEALRSRFWMTPPNETYTLPLSDLIQISHTYNEYLEDISKTYELQFCSLAEHIPPTELYFYDDVHFNENGALRVSEVISSCVNDYLNKN